MRHNLFKNDTKKSKNITRYGSLEESGALGALQNQGRRRFF